MKKYTLLKRITCFVWAALLANMFTQAQNVLKVQTGATITTTGGAVITLRDMDLDNDGTSKEKQPAW